MSDFVLDLDEFIEPSGEIRVGGKSYALRQWGQMGLIEQQHNRKRWQRIVQIEAMPEVSKKLQAEHDDVLRQLVCAISDMPAADAEALPLEQLGRAALGFFVMRSRLIEANNERMHKMTDLSIGASSSPASMPDGREREPANG